MRAWLMDSYAGVDKLRLGELPDPRPGVGDVLVQVRFAALNPADAFLASGLYPAKPPLPHVLGRDGAGVVASVGTSVRDIRSGDKVGILRCDIGVDSWGTLAEQAEASGVKVLIITGYTFQLANEDLGRYEFLMKPVRPAELIQAIERTLGPRK